MQVLPINGVDKEVVKKYWKSLEAADTLKYRLSDVDNPVWDDVLEMMSRMGSRMFVVVESGIVIAEFMLENFTGKAAQIHFSFHPKCKNKSEACKLTLDTCFKSFDTIFGLTPIKNRVACVFALMNGFKKLGILPSGCVYMGEIVDAQISIAVKGLV